MRVFVCLASLWVSLTWACVCAEGQPPRNDQSDDRHVPLRQLPIPADSTVIVTPDLKKALDALGAGSVVISAERYRELMSKLAQAPKGEKDLQEILFARMHMEGEVKSENGRETAEITWELEFFAEAANTLVFLPFKGVRFSEATLNGAAPLWGPDPERLSLLVKQAQSAKIRLSASLPVVRSGNEKRILIERLPSAAVTSLDITIPGAISQAVVRDYGSIPVNAGENNRSRLQTKALGVLTSLDLSWQTTEGASPAPAPSIEGELRVTLDDDQATHELKLRPVPFKQIQLPWKIRLPSGSTQIQAELRKIDGSNSEPLIVTRNSDGTLRISSPYPLGPSEYSHVFVRWQQVLPVPGTKEPQPIGAFEVLEPIGQQQRGVITVVQVDEPMVLLRPKNLTDAERVGGSSFERDPKRTQRFRYAQQPFGLDVIPLPHLLTRGVVEAKLSHNLASVGDLWVWTTDLQILRTTRASLTSIELHWPGEWVVNRKVLFSPVVKEIEQDEKNQRLKVILDGKQPDSFSIQLESSQNRSNNTLKTSIPFITEIQGLRNGRAVSVERALLPEKLTIEQRHWQIALEPGNLGIEEEERPGIDAPEASRESARYTVLTHPTTIVATRQQRLPMLRARMDVYLGGGEIDTRQVLEFRWRTPSPRQLHFLVPKAVKYVQFQQQLQEGGKLRLLPTVASEEDGSIWVHHALTVPSDAVGGLTLICTTQSSLEGELIAVPIIRPAEKQAHLESPVQARCFTESSRAARLAEGMTGWRVQRDHLTRLELQSDSLDSILPLTLKDNPSSTLPKSRLDDVHCDVIRSATGQMHYYQARFADIQSTHLTLRIAVARSEIMLRQLSINEEQYRPDQFTWNEIGEETELSFRLPPSALNAPLTVKALFELAAPGSVYPIGFERFPALTWKGIENQYYPMTWKIQSDTSRWLLYSNQPANEGLTSYGLLPIAAQPGHSDEAGTRGSSPTLTFRAGTISKSLLLTTVSRLWSVLILSVVSYAFCRIVGRRQARLQTIGLIGLGFIIIVRLAAPEAVPVFLWGALPGITIALLVSAIERSLQRRQGQRPQVFQSRGLLEKSGYATSAPSSPGLAEAPTYLSGARSAAR